MINNFKTLPEEDKKKLAEAMFKKIDSAQELKDWILLFFGLDMPYGSIDPDSSSDPVSAMWEIYQTVKNNSAGQTPGFIMLSAREAFKTLSAAILETILMVQFELTIAHLAAIQSQSAKAVQYVNYFFGKIQPLLEVSGWRNTSQNKNKIEYTTPDGEIVYIKVVVATVSGANCIDPGALVMVEGKGQIRAIEIEKGDKVLTRDYLNNKDVWVTSEGIQIAIKSARKLILENGAFLTVSDDHPVFTDSGWIRASQVKLGQSVIYNNSFESNEGMLLEAKQQDRTLDQMILGTLLGDASIHRIPSGKIRYSVSHSANHLDYILETQKVLLDAGIESNICKDKNNFKLTSKTSEKLRKYYNLAINQETKKKTVTKEWLDQLSNEGLAYWIMDDGRGNGTQVGSRKEHCFELATCGFSENEHTIIGDFFANRGIKTSVKKITNQSRKFYSITKIDLSGSRILSEVISPYFVKSLRYKLLSTPSEATDQWLTDSGERVQKLYIKHNVFTWAKQPNLKSERETVKTIRSQLNNKIVRIELIGYQELVDLSVRTDNKTLHSFYANGILVHNSEHTNAMFVDEIDVVKDPLAYEEAKLIPGYSKGIYPITVKLSTRKYAFGLMQKELDLIPISGDKLLNWNILDVTEACPPERHKPNLPKVDRYVAKNLPLSQISEEQYEGLPDAEKAKWTLIADAHAGCATCALLPVCKTRLAHRSQDDRGGLYKPIDVVINTFKKTSADMAEAQLMCWKPSTRGLVYPRFETTIDKGNVISVGKAWETIFGEPSRKQPTSEIDLLQAMKNLDIRFYAGVDWGTTHPFALVIFALIPNGEIWVVDSYSASGLEFSDCLEIAKSYRDKYDVDKWYADTAMPAFIKTFNKNHMRCIKFTKDVMGGIEALRSKIIDGHGRRLLKVLNIDANKKVINSFVKHHFLLDTAGNPTIEPDNTMGVADMADAMRYLAQNLFPIKGPQKPEHVWADPIMQQNGPKQNPTREEQMRQEIANRITDGGQAAGGTGKKGGFFYNF